MLPLVDSQNYTLKKPVSEIAILCVPLNPRYNALSTSNSSYFLCQSYLTKRRAACWRLSFFSLYKRTNLGLGVKFPSSSSRQCLKRHGVSTVVIVVKTWKPSFARLPLATITAKRPRLFHLFCFGIEVLTGQVLLHVLVVFFPLMGLMNLLGYFWKSKLPAFGSCFCLSSFTLFIYLL